MSEVNLISLEMTVWSSFTVNSSLSESFFFLNKQLGTCMNIHVFTFNVVKPW